MSEGPEAKRTARELDAQLAGQTIREIQAHHRAIRAVLETNPEALIGRKILNVHTIGKHILFALDNGSHLHNHLLMFGRWKIYSARAKIPPNRYVMEIIRTDNKRAVLVGGSVMELIEAGGLEKHRTISKLGPDVLGETFDLELAVQNLKRHPDLEIGVALLEQEIFAGVGNYLKSEILFLARTNPRVSIRDLSEERLREIVSTAREVSIFSFEHASYTIPEAIRARADEKGMSPWTVGKRHWVFRRTNKPCWNCGTPIRQFRQGKGRGRITYVCPTCQGIAA